MPNATLGNTDLASGIQKLDESVTGLTYGAAILGYYGSAPKSEPLEMRNIKANDALYVIEACQSAVVDDLHKMLDRMENSLVTSLEDFLTKKRFEINGMDH